MHDTSLQPPARRATAYNHPAFAPSVLPAPPSLQMPGGAPVPSLGDLLFLPLNDLTKLPLGYINLLCATALPDTADLDIPACMRTLAQWTSFVQRETDRQMYKFKRDPGDFQNSEAYFRVLVIITALQRDLGVTYDPGCRDTPKFKNSREGFIHGLLTGDKRGTCANMPVLYTAVGRNLGYPIYLVTAKAHLFCRWHSARTGERFNNRKITRSGDRFFNAIRFDAQSKDGDDCSYCFKTITISSHGTSGSIDFTNNDSLTRGTFKLDRQNALPPSMKAPMDLLRAIKGKLCAGGTVRFVACYSASLAKELKNFFGADVEVVTYPGKVKWTPIGPY